MGNWRQRHHGVLTMPADRSKASHELQYRSVYAEC
jgi:hypothetical protein